MWKDQQTEAVARLTWLSMAILNPHSFSIAWPHRLVVLDSVPPYRSYRLKCVSNSLRQDLAAQLLRVNKVQFFNLFQGTDAALNVILGELWEGFVLSELSGGPTHQVKRASYDSGEEIPEECEVLSLDDGVDDMEVQLALGSDDVEDSLVERFGASIDPSDSSSPHAVPSEEPKTVNTACWARGLVARQAQSASAFTVTLSVSAQQCVRNNGESVEDKVKPQSGLLLVPESANFPACDAILYQEVNDKRYIYLLQMTIAGSHPTKASALSSVYDMLSGWADDVGYGCWHPSRADVRLVFVVPGDKWSRFKRLQSITCESGHPQPNPKQFALTLQSATAMRVKTAANSATSTPSRPGPRTETATVPSAAAVASSELTGVDRDRG